MGVNKEKYGKYIEKNSKKSPLLKNCIKAFLIGGAICTLGQALLDLFLYLDVSKDTAKALVLVCLMLITAILTGLGVFDKIAKHAGAGTLVPITGFANSVVAPAIDNKSEGYVMGLGANIFIIAGPVILYGCVASVIYGVIYWITTLF